LRLDRGVKKPALSAVKGRCTTQGPENQRSDAKASCISISKLVILSETRDWRSQCLAQSKDPYQRIDCDRPIRLTAEE